MIWIILKYNFLCSLCNNNDTVKIRSMVNQLSKNQERLRSKYWHLRKQSHFIKSFLDGINHNANGSNGSSDVMNHILAVVCDLLVKKLPFSDDLLIWAWQYCGYHNNNKLKLRLLNIINKILECSLAYDNPCKTRDYLYLKQYFLNSNIWYQIVRRRDNSNINRNWF